MNIRVSTPDELTEVAQIDQQAHASRFINAMSLAEHIANFERPDVTYLSILNASGQFAGYFILVSTPADETVEFRRIAIDRNHRGIGQGAIVSMERYCRTALNKTRIWLDVYGDNEIGIHIYSKLGYRFDREESCGDRLLKFYSKSLVS